MNICGTKFGLLKNAVLNLVQEKKKVVSKGSETKRLRKERGELEKIIFRLFERQAYWTSKQLIQETDQPEVRFILHTYRKLSLHV